MKVVLVKPFNPHTYSFVPPIGLGYLASMLKIKGGHEVFLYEAVRDQLASIAPFKIFLAEHKPDVVGIQVYSVDLHIVREYLRCVKGYNSRIVTVMGGPHPAADPLGTMDYFGEGLLDYCMAGEAEKSFLALVNHLEGQGPSLKDVAGLVWRDPTRHRDTNLKEDESCCRINAKEVVENLDELPWPDWDLLSPKHYPPAPLGGVAKHFPVGPIMVSRGCPLKCTFCAAKSVYGNGFRVRNIDSVIEEIQYLRRSHGVKEIMILDDNITFRKSLVLEFCEKMAPLRIPWNCANGIRADMVTEEIVKALKEAGCYLVAIGIESGSQRIVNDMQKKIILERIREKVDLLTQYGIHVVGLFMLGYPTETKEDVLKTIAFAKRLNISAAAFANFLPLPGSPVYEAMKREGRLEDLDLGGMNYYQARRSFTPHISVEELNHLLKRAMREFHLRPRILYRTLRRSGSLANLFYLGKRLVERYV